MLDDFNLRFMEDPDTWATARQLGMPSAGPKPCDRSLASIRRACRTDSIPSQHHGASYMCNEPRMLREMTASSCELHAPCGKVDTACSSSLVSSNLLYNYMRKRPAKSLG